MIYCTALPPSRSCPSRSVTFYPPTITQASPCDGLLEIARGKKTTRYAVSEGILGRGFGSGRCFQLLKADGAVYWVFLASDRRMSSCDCAGCSYGATEKADRKHGNSFGPDPCCHIAALAAVVDAGKLPDPRAGDPYQDVSNTEVDQFHPDYPANLQGGF